MRVVASALGLSRSNLIERRQRRYFVRRRRCVDDSWRDRTDQGGRRCPADLWLPENDAAGAPCAPCQRRGASERETRLPHHEGPGLAASATHGQVHSHARRRDHHSAIEPAVVLRRFRDPLLERRTRPGGFQPRLLRPRGESLSESLCNRA